MQEERNNMTFSDQMSPGREGGGGTDGERDPRRWWEWGGGEGDYISCCSSHHQNDILHQIKTDSDVRHSSVINIAVGVKCP